MNSRSNFSRGYPHLNVDPGVFRMAAGGWPPQGLSYGGWGWPPRGLSYGGWGCLCSPPGGFRMAGGGISLWSRQAAKNPPVSGGLIHSLQIITITIGTSTGQGSFRGLDT